MSDVSATGRSADPATRSSARRISRAAPPAEDVRAMGEAFRRARGGLPGRADAAMPRGTGKGAGVAARTGAAPDATAPAGPRTGDEQATLDRRDADRHPDQGFAGLAQHAAVPVVVAAQPPSPLVDPTAFAQLLADLWTRENGRGPREVRVRFGAATWPATGATLVRSADGLLDVTVDMAPGTADARIDVLETALGARGLAIGRVAIGATAA
ncbi:hypothetical protein ASG29_02510 [Sphingomonas sp. Leaf412]|uniref:hypothetical protein n=1 Tax=Sphingomonas sp. Leaf412 TaxID=1736370 RepID=UPI0006FEE6F3|nr:hypothetical protein [Sphingomonas sp. Leaf412]KQT35023.1 hypothetical protein ASG29_02510 [Sphingomonas sp. Leaf412]